jgi:predicted Rossmann fold flavoprotein
MMRVAVIGGGASGLLAAYFSAAGGNRVTLFERQKMLARKVLASGNGRCNISNRKMDESFFHGRDPRFAALVLERFGLEETTGFFAGIGIPFTELERGRLYPASLQATSVKKALEYQLRKKGVEVILHRKIELIVPESGKLRLVTAGHEEFLFDAAVIAAGSCAYSSLGASRSGYELAAALGHRIHEPFPSILPLNVPSRALHRLDGIKWDCGVAVELDGGVRARSEEELLFTKYGISGPAAMEVSRAVHSSVLAGGKPVVVIDLFPRHDGEELEQLLDGLWADGDKKLSMSLLGILKERMPELALGVACVDSEARVGMLTGEQKKRIAGALKNIRLEPGPSRGFGEAVVAAGGVDTGEVDPRTMESKLVKNLYITGELLDIDGDSGGYNLQFAWSTGAIAGMALRG